MRHYDLIIVGGGSAGLGAALEARKNGIADSNILIVEKSAYLGGILNQCIHTGFGLSEFKEELTGPEYADRFIKQLNCTNINILLNTMVVRINSDKTIIISSEGNYEKLSFKSLILATGCLERSAGAIRLIGDRPQGVMTAGQAQNYLNNLGYLPGKNVFILGSGDIGLIMARRMTLEGAKVIGVAELMPYSNGLKRNIVQCLDDYNIPLYLSTTVTNIFGKTHLEKIELSSVDENLNPIPGTEKIINCDCLLLSVGLIPYTSLLDNLNLEKDKFGKLKINEKCETSFPGLFICGNSLHVHDLVDNVTKESRTAGFFAAKYILDNTAISKFSEVISGKNVSYVIPNIISSDSKEFDIKFRIKRPLNNVSIVIRNENQIIKKIKKFAMIPSEMEIIKIKHNLDQLSEITVEVIEDE